jgi:hypothetical protein
MIYKKHEILAEAVTESATYTLDDNGELAEYRESIDREPEATCYAVEYDGDIIEWFDTITECKQYIDKLGV